MTTRTSYLITNHDCLSRCLQMLDGLRSHVTMLVSSTGNSIDYIDYCTVHCMYPTTYRWNATCKHIHPKSKSSSSNARTISINRPHFALNSWWFIQNMGGLFMFVQHFQCSHALFHAQHLRFRASKEVGCQIIAWCPQTNGTT